MKLFNTAISGIICFWICCFDIQAQKIPSYNNVKHYDIFDGLSNNWISDIYQDKDGFIWFGTQYGINRFDGQNFKKFTYVPGDTTALKANWVRSITQLENNKLYLGTFGEGAVVLNPYLQKFSKLVIKQDTGNYDLSYINKIVPDTNNDLWISTATAAYRYRSQDSTIQRIYNKRASNISISSDGSNLILGREQDSISKNQDYRHAIFKVIEDRIQKIPLRKSQKPINTFSVSEDSLLVYTDKNLLLLHQSDKGWQQRELDFETTYQTTVRDVPFIMKDLDGWTWVNGGDKIYRFSSDYSYQESIAIEELLDYQSSTPVRANCMLQDREGNLWIGTNLGAFQLIPHKPFRHPKIGSLGKVREIVECGNKVWFALPDGIYAWDKNDGNQPKKAIQNTVTSMVCANDGFIYTMGNDAEGKVNLMKIDPNSSLVERIYFSNLGFELGVSYRIIEDLDQRLWIAQWDNIIVYDLKDQSYFRIQVFKKNTGIIDLYPDSFDNIWLASLGEGLIKFENASNIKKNGDHSFKRYIHDIKNPNSISSNLIQSIEQDNQNLLWIGTDGGLNSLDINTEKFNRYLRNDQMPSDKILNVISDKRGKLWLSTISHGILSFDIQTKKFNHYVTTDGLYDNSMLLSSKYLGKDGSLWLGSEGGIQNFHPDELISSKVKNPNMIWESYTKFKADTSLTYRFPNKNSSIKNSIRIEPEDQNISFQFKTLIFEKPEKVRYHFKLEGYHKDWLPPQEKGDLTLSYIPKGSYELLAKSTYEDQEDVLYSPIIITVIPPWYQTNFAYILYALLIASSIFVVYRIQLRRKIAETEKEFVTDLAKSKTKWFNQIAHEFRTPLTVILGATDQIRDRLGDKIAEKTDKHLSQIEDQTSHLSNQVQKILEIAQMQDNQLKIQLTDGDFVGFQKYIFHSFTSLAEKKGIKLEFSSSQETAFISFDEDKWRKITSNLVSNAIKYNREGGTVLFSVDINELDQNVTLQVKDNGVGISEKLLSKLFDPFTKEETKNPQGVGLGLTLTKELVNLMNGSIAVKSQKNNGTTFTVKAPVIFAHQEHQNADFDLIISEHPEKPVILVAEDHKEVRDYIHFCLSPNFTVLQAENGLIAWKLCEKHLPDLVISDVMMPEWDGIQLGTAIRKHLATNHIPFILLTSKSGQSNQIAGLKTGADAYLTKPFDRNELLIRVENLIKTRKKLQEKYQSGDITITSENKNVDTFMKDVIQIIYKQLDNDEFGVPQLAEHLHISRVHLFRKIKQLTGLAPTKFIRKIRLQKAQQLITTSNLSISEIAYQIGFKDPAYFSRVYAEEFGRPPSEFRK